MKKIKPSKFRLNLKGSAIVFIDWANVYYWKNSLKKEIDIKKLYKYLKSYPQIKKINFYFGTDSHPKSREQILLAKKIGYRTVTKPVKYLPHITEKGEKIWIRKCDFDLEIGLDTFEKLNQFNTFIFFSGDGDFATLYRRLARKEKHSIVVFAQGHLGKEIRVIEKGVYLCSVARMLPYISSSKKYPPAKGQGHN